MAGRGRRSQSYWGRRQAEACPVVGVRHSRSVNDRAACAPRVVAWTRAVRRTAASDRARAAPCGRRPACGIGAHVAMLPTSRGESPRDLHAACPRLMPLPPLPECGFEAGQPDVPMPGTRSEGRTRGATAGPARAAAARSGRHPGTPAHNSLRCSLLRVRRLRRPRAHII